MNKQLLIYKKKIYLYNKNFKIFTIKILRFNNKMKLFKISKIIMNFLKFNLTNHQLKNKISVKRNKLNK